MTESSTEETSDILNDFAKEILQRVDAEGPAKRKSHDSLATHENGFELKFKVYEEEIERLKASLEKARLAGQVSEDKLATLTRELHQEQELTQKLMRNINELTESNQYEVQKERELLKSEAASEMAKKDDTIADLRMELAEARAAAAEGEAGKGVAAARIAELEHQIQDFHLNYVRKEEFDRAHAEKIAKENQVDETENRLAIEMAKIATYEAQIERLKTAAKGYLENESRMRLETDQLNSQIVSLKNEIKMLNSTRKGSLQLAEDTRVSGNLDIEESGYNSIYFSRVEDDVGKRIEEMERQHSEATAQLKSKIRDLILANEALNNEVIKLKDQQNSMKTDSVVLKRSSCLYSQREVSKVRRHEVSEDVLEKMLGFEVQNKRLKEENGLLNRRLTEVVKGSAANAALVYLAAVGFLGE